MRFGRLLEDVTQTAAVMLYAFSLITFPFLTAEPQMRMHGFEVLLLGWLGSVAWLANPLFVVAVVMSKRAPVWATLCAVAAALLAVLCYPYVGSLGFDSGGEIEAGRVTGLGPGAYLWWSSLATGLVFCLMRLVSSRRAQSAL
jgi:hypothetical protein